jgi:hypothetical protein
LKDAGEHATRFQRESRRVHGSYQRHTQVTELTGADLTLKIDHTEIGNLLKTLELPAIATGPMRIDTESRMSERAGSSTSSKARRRRCQLERHTQDASLVDSDLKFDITAANAARARKCI